MLSGIYIITNKITNKHYIGQAVFLKRRLRDHRYSLRGNRHHNFYLQSSWNKHGEEAFSFEILELCPVEDLVAREIEWTTFFKPAGVYNIGTIEAPMLGRRHTPEAIQKMRRPKSKEVKEKISAALSGKKHSKEHAKKTGLPKRKSVLLVSANKIFDSIQEAASFLGVHPFTLGRHLNGRSTTCKGEILKFIKKA